MGVIVEILHVTHVATQAEGKPSKLKVDEMSMMA
jgi:hypothetical protein